jgi:hypothetical protein
MPGTSKNGLTVFEFLVFFDVHFGGHFMHSGGRFMLYGSAVWLDEVVARREVHNSCFFKFNVSIDCASGQASKLN